MADKVKIVFTAGASLPLYNSVDLGTWFDGEVKEVDAARAEGLLRDWPDNFAIADSKTKPTGPPADKMMRGAPEDKSSDAQPEGAAETQTQQDQPSAQADTRKRR